MIWMGVAGNPALLFSAVGAQTVLREGLGGTMLSLSSPDSRGMVGQSWTAAKGGVMLLQCGPSPFKFKSLY